MQIVVQKNTVKPFFSFVTFLKQESDGQPDITGARHPAGTRSSL
jgi:hypothetical protein